MKNEKMKQFLVIIAILAAGIIASPARGMSLEGAVKIQHADSLILGFQTPPGQAKARTWWHWINGNVSREGITADLEAMKEVGIQEAQLFNVGHNFPDGPISYLSEEWLELFHFAAQEAQRLGLELAFHNSAGWSSSGGPWMKPEHAMQTIVYTEVDHIGGTTYDGRLPQPKIVLNYYQDIAVLAFPKPTEEVRVPDLDYKSLSGRVRNHLTPDTTAISAAGIIRQEDIIDLSKLLSADGSLEWDAPEGEWVILRLGHTPTGTENHPAVRGGQGLECDKMSKEAVDIFWQGGLAPIIDKLDTLIGTVVNNCLIDSYEVGTANWTPAFAGEFEQLRGYDMKIYMPALAGYYIDSGEVTERFLWDFRRTIGDLMAKNYYSHFSKLCHENGLKFSVEPYWGPFDNMQVGATGDIVMCEFWSGGYPFFDSPKFVSSIANLNGNTIVGAEAFTGFGGWLQHPAMLKSIGDQAWAQGINRFIFHTYVHQPWNIGPGLTLGVWGIDFNRLNTWWQQGKAFLEYISRSQFLLQQGRTVADVLVFTGDSSPNNALLMPELKALGYDYDLIGANKLPDLSVKEGDIITSVGGQYKVLYLPNTSWIRPETLKILEQLAKSGAKIIGSKPQKSPSLTNYPHADGQIQHMAEGLWGTGLITEESVEEYISTALSPDIRVEQGNEEDLSFLHKRTKDTDIYFIANAQKNSRREKFRFRMHGKQPELWNAESGKIENIAEWRENEDGTLSIPIHLESEEAVFVVFRKAIEAAYISESSSELKAPQTRPSANMQIVKAEYGSFLQEGLVDVTSELKQKVQGDKIEINANRLLCDCDPAQGYKKELRVKYKIGDEVKEVYLMEKETIIIEAAEGDLEIVKGVFGKFKPETRGIPEDFPTIDISHKVQEMIAAGKMEIHVSDKLIPGKIALGSSKTLNIHYKVDGEERFMSVPDGQVLSLSPYRPNDRLKVQQKKIFWETPYPGALSFTNSSGITKTAKVKSVPQPIGLEGEWQVRFSDGASEGKSIAFDSLYSWSKSSDESIRYFSGTAIYHKQFELEGDDIDSASSMELDLGNVLVIAEVSINGHNLGLLWRAPYKVNIEEYVLEGTNTMEVKVTNLWPNKLVGEERYAKDIDRKGAGVKTLPDWLDGKTERNSKRSTFAAYKHWHEDSELQVSGLLGPVLIRSFKEVEVMDLQD